MPRSGGLSDVLLVCADEDRQAAAAIARALTDEGFGVAEAGEASAVIVLWSAAAARSRAIRAAAEAAYEQGRLVQLSADGGLPPLPFKQLHCVSIHDWGGEPEHPGWASARRSVAALCGLGEGR